MRRKKSSGRPPAPSITAAEWTVMRVLWERGAATANEVVQALEGAVSWKPRTVQTLLRRLTDKGVLQTGRAGREYIFCPVFTAWECQLAESRSFLERVFGTAALTPLVAAFAGQEELTAGEIFELRRILEKLEEEAKP